MARALAAPTARAALLLGAVALAALVLPPWLSVGLALVLVAATVADAWSVRVAPSIRRQLPDTVYRGVPARLTARATAPGRTVLLRQPPAPGLAVDPPHAGTGEIDVRLVPLRRGRHLLPGVASASLGPLGLARVHHPTQPALEVRVLPDVAGARRLIVRLRRTLGGAASGLARGPLGLGTEFESVRDYSPDDDIRQLNWRASARLGRPMSNQYRIERDRDVICMLDCGRLSAAPLDGSSVLDVGLDATTVLALAADELGDRFGAVSFDSDVRRVLLPRHRGGAAAVEALFDLTPSAVDSDFESAFGRISRSRRGLVFVFTDLLDEAAARSLLAGIVMLVRRHSVLIAGATDPALSELAADRAEPARALAALDVLAARRQAATALRLAGAQVLEAPPERLAERCIHAYLRAKLRARV